MLQYLSEGGSPSQSVLAYLASAQLRKQKSLSNGKQSLTVMIVDDEETLANTTAEILNAAGFYAFVAYDGETALDLAAKLLPDILLTDVVMPNMNGVELALAVEDKFPQTTVILFSGQAGTSDIIDRAQAEGHSFELLAKPIHPLKLIERLKRLAGK
jgi:DNA-binding response OmpR family regulator